MKKKREKQDTNTFKTITLEEAISTGQAQV